MSTHTPGPWTIQPDSNPSRPFNIFGKDGAIVADAYCDNYLMEDLTGEPQANARLIAAAPRMEAALVNLLQYCNGRLGKNPYGIPEFIEGLQALGEAWGVKDKYSVNESANWKAIAKADGRN
jgi:hypothetical protein